MTDEYVYARRAIERKRARHTGRRSTLSAEKLAQLQVRILADRLALALAAMSSHEEVIRYGDALKWMKYHEDWADTLTSIEPRVTRGRQRRFSHHRQRQLYRYYKNAIRTLVRQQVAEELGVYLEEDQDGDEPDTVDSAGNAEAGVHDGGSGGEVEPARDDQARPVQDH